MKKRVSLVSCSALLMFSAMTVLGQSKVSDEPKAWPHGPYDKLIPPAPKAEDSAILPFREAEKALQKAFEYIDGGKVQFKDATIKRDDVEPVSVSYGFDQREKLITVDFRVKSAVKSNYFEFVYGILSVHLDEQGRLRGQSAGEHHGSVPSKQWKITP